VGVLSGKYEVFKMERKSGYYPFLEVGMKETAYRSWFEGLDSLFSKLIFSDKLILIDNDLNCTKWKANERTVSRGEGTQKR
jgi:hypothetical protein